MTLPFPFFLYYDVPLTVHTDLAHMDAAWQPFSRGSGFRYIDVLQKDSG